MHHQHLHIHETRVSTLPIYEQVEGLVRIHFESSKNAHTDNASTTTTIATAGRKEKYDLCRSNFVRDF